jgi:MFS family permease
MTTYSAFDAISPAIERTNYFLFKPFRFGRFLKLTLIACFAEASYTGFSSNFNVPIPGKTPQHIPFQVPQLHWPTPGVWMLIVAAFLLLFLPLSIFISYLLYRLRFSYFDCVLYLQDKIGPGWRKYHRQALRYLGVSLLVGLGFLAALAVTGLIVWNRYKDVIAGLIAAQGHKTHLNIDFMALFGALAGIFFVVFLIGIAGYVIQTIMTYFVLPHMALEDASIGHAFADVWDDMKVEPGQFVLFLIMRVLLSIAAGLIATIAMIIPLIGLAAIAAIIGYAVHAMFHSTFVLVPLVILAGVVVGALLFACGISIAGTIGTFSRNYGLLFYAGRYPELAARLWPAPPPTSASAQP